jgi:hypothetical protein
MSRDLEALLEAYDAWRQAADATQAEQRQAAYSAGIEQTSALLRINPDTLDALVRRKYLPWLRAQRKFPTLPPRA